MEHANQTATPRPPRFNLERIERFSPGEEIANTLSHSLGAIFSITALVIMLLAAARSGGAREIISVTVYGLLMMLLYVTSTMTHILLPGYWKDFFHNFDQIAIYLLIAGTYTPFALLVLRNDWGWVMFALQWFLALNGIVIKLLMPNRFEKGVNVLTVVSYAIMGWMLLFFIFPLSRNMPAGGIGLIILGGAFYTLGIIFFKMKNVRFSHLIWHLMVLAGSVIHWWAVMKYVLAA